MSRLASLVVGVALWALSLAAAAQVVADIVTVGSASALPGAAVDIPLSIRDTSGTPLGLDQPAGSRIQSYSISVGYAPAAAVQSVTAARAGVTASLTPTFEASPSAPGTISLLDTFSESTNLIPFTLNAPAPGNQVGVLHFVLSASAVPGTTITLTLDPSLTQLTDQGGQIRETVATANLTLINGAITVLQPLLPPQEIPALSWRAFLLLVAALGLVGVRTYRRSARR